MAFELSTVSAYIASLTISGVTVKDYSDVKDAADIRLCPLLQPDVNSQVTFQTLERNSYGTGTTAKQTLYYLIPYVLLYAPAGSERNLGAILPGMITAMSAIVTAIITHDAPSDHNVDLTVAGFTLGQTVSDPAGNPFHGVQIVMRVKEFVN